LLLRRFDQPDDHIRIIDDGGAFLVDVGINGIDHLDVRPRDPEPSRLSTFALFGGLTACV